MTTYWQFLRRPIAIAILAGLLFFGGVTFFSLQYPLATGAIAQGELVHLSKRLPIGHASGGRIHEVLVRDGDQVEAGDALLQLESPELRRQQDVLSQRFVEFAVTVARYDALIEERETVIVDIDAPAHVVARHQSLLERERRALSKRLDLMLERIELKRSEIEGLREVEGAKQRELAEIDEQVALYEELERRGAAPKMRVMEMRRQRHEIDSELSEIRLQRQRAGIEINDAKLQFENERAEAFRRYERERSDFAAEAAEVETQLASIESNIDELTVRAPVDGTVIDLRFTGPGAVLEPNSEALALVPDGETFLVQASLSPLDVDRVAIGQVADISFSALPSRYMAGLKATLVRVDAGRTDSEQGSFYRAWLELSPEAMRFALDNDGVVSGAPVEVRILTGERTLANYLTEPLTGWWFKGLRET